MNEAGSDCFKRSSPSVDTQSPCPICLGPISQDSYLDRCFHKFCYKCVVRWTNIVAKRHSQTSQTLSSLKCPLCKTENFSIIHEYDGCSFQQHYINQSSENSFFFSKAHKSRLRCYYTEPGPLNEKFDVSRYWKSRKYLRQNQCLPDWLQREIQALMQEEDVSIVVHHILGVIDSFRKCNEQSTNSPKVIQQRFRALVAEAAGPFLAGRTERFVIEAELFLAAGLNLKAYDEVYMNQLGWTTPSSSTTSNNAEAETPNHNDFNPCLYFFDDSDEGSG